MSEHIRGVQAERFYRLHTNDAAGVSLPIVINASRELCDDLLASAKAGGINLLLIRERQSKPIRNAHPAQRFLEIAICHECSHTAARHSQNGCESCFLDALDAAPFGDVEPTLDGERAAFDWCERSPQLVVLDAIADFALHGLSLTAALHDFDTFAESAVWDPDTTGLGYAIRTRRPDERRPNAALSPMGEEPSQATAGGIARARENRLPSSQAREPSPCPLCYGCRVADTMEPAPDDGLEVVLGSAPCPHCARPEVGLTATERTENE